MPTGYDQCCGMYCESETTIELRCNYCGSKRHVPREKFVPNYDHIGPIDGYCFMSLNFTPEQYAKVNDIIVRQLIGKDLDYGVEGAIVDLIHDERAHFSGEVSYLIVKLIRSLPRGHEVAEEAIVWLTNRGLVLEDILREVQP